MAIDGSGAGARANGSLPSGSKCQGQNRADETLAWVIEIRGVEPAREPARVAVLALGDGVIGTRAEAPGDPGGGGVLGAGVYHGSGATSALAPLPQWNHAPFDDAVVRSRVFDLRDGTLRCALDLPAGEASTLTFASLARPGTAVLVADGPALARARPRPLLAPLGCEHGSHGDRTWAVVGDRGGAAVAASDRVVQVAAARVRLERLVAFAVDPRQPPRAEAAFEALEAAERIGVEGLLVEQRSAWARRWSAADIRIEGDPELQRAVRFSLFHLMASVSDRSEAALGAKGQSGPGYRGHVFWDTDVFVLPFLAATHPPAARALVGYRVQRLAAARAAAARGGFAGARFPWESGDTGHEITPGQIRDAHGRLVPVLTGEQEEHITADVAWATDRYQAWSGDREMLPASRALLRETARYWASRIDLDTRGVGHINAVIGPDEYHEHVDDNAFTNAMVRWNLARAAALQTPGDAEAGHWRSLARALADGYDAPTHRHEQFAGYFELEPLTVADLSGAADPVDLLGWAQLQRGQLIKQADVLMLHLLVPDLAPEGSLDADIDWYEPRTTHASSLSAPVHAAVLARAGRVDAALDYLRRSATIDLEDTTGRTSEGLHIATMGGVWHALVHGIAGLELHGQTLSVRPHLPRGWDALEFNVQLHGVQFGIRILPDRVAVHARTARAVRVGAGESWIDVGPEGVLVAHDALEWRPAP